MKKYNIAFIDPMSYSNLEKYDLGVMSQFNNENCTFYCSSLLSKNENYNSIKIKKIFSYSEKSNRLSSLISYIRSMIFLFFCLKETKPDIIHIQWVKLFIFDYFFYYFLKKIIPDSKLIFTAHNIKPHNCSNNYFMFYKKIYTLFNIIIVHNQFTKNSLLSINKDLIVKVIPHGLIPLVDDGLVNSDILNSFSKKKHTFCFIGRASHYKGFDILLESWEKYFNENDEIQLIIAGRIDNEFKILKNKLWHNVVFIDRFLNESELKFIIQNSFSCILPYREISQSGVLLTVLPYHIPLIVSNCGGLTEPLSINPDIGIMIELPLTCTAIRNSISQFIEQKDKYLLIQNNPDNWNSIENFYDWTSISLMTLQTYYSL